MDITQWSQLALICVLGAMSPGPSLALILRNTISGGRNQGIMSGIGHGLGITLYAVIALTGLVTLLKTFSNFFLISQIVGSLFLVLLGGKMIFSSIGDEQNNREPKPSTISKHIGFSEGFLIAFLNPKIAVWLLALFSQFISPNASLNEQLVLVSTVGGIDTCWYCLVSFLASSRRVVASLKHNAKRIDFIMGSLLIFLAAGMLWPTILLFS